ncbi:MAG TPA: hypothetical protein VF532_25055 [Candidatus Angelobacter sp.]
MKSTFIATQRTHALLCELLGDYIAQRDTRPRLAALKEELGAAEYTNFQGDLRALMFKRNAAAAVKIVIAESVKRREKAQFNRQGEVNVQVPGRASGSVRAQQLAIGLQPSLSLRRPLRG